MTWKRFRSGVRKPLTRQRLKWFTVIALATLFGRRLEVEGSEKKTKVLPVIWKGRLYLLGLQHHIARIRFASKYKARVIEIPHVAPSVGERSPDAPAPGRGFAHAVLIHYAPEITNRLIALWKSLLF